MTARRAGRLSAAVLAALGALSLIEALRLRDDWQGARLMPAVVGAVLLALAVAHLTASMPDTAVAPPHSAGRRRVVLLFGGLVVYVLLLPAAGFGVATALFALALLRALGGYSWARSVVLSALAAAAGELLFRQWLHMPLP